MLSLAIFALLSLSSPSTGTVIPAASPVLSPRAISPRDTVPIPNCAAASADDHFEISDIAYELYLNKPGGIDTTPDQITMAFSVTNNASGVETACSFLNSRHASPLGPVWADNGTKWWPCGDRIVGEEGGTTYVIKTNAQFAWSKFTLRVNQTWICGDGVEEKETIFSGVAEATLSPDCKVTNTTAWWVKECSAPAMNAPVVLSLS